MDKSLLLGFITREGSSNSHTAILARSMNIPALDPVQGHPGRLGRKMAVVDGYNACVYVDPTPDLLQSLQGPQQEDQKKQALLQELKGKPKRTLDGRKINVFANIGGMSDVGAVQQEQRRRRGLVPHRVRLPELQGLPHRGLSVRGLQAGAGKPGPQKGRGAHLSISAQTRLWST